MVTTRPTDKHVGTHTAGDRIIPTDVGEQGVDLGYITKGIVICATVIADNRVETVTPRKQVALRPPDDQIITRSTVNGIGTTMGLGDHDRIDIGIESAIVGQGNIDTDNGNRKIIDRAVVTKDDFISVIRSAAMNRIVPRAADNGIAAFIVAILIDLIIAAVGCVVAFGLGDDIAAVSGYGCPITEDEILALAAVDRVATNPIGICVSGTAGNDIIARTARDNILAAEGRIRGVDVIGQTGIIPTDDHTIVAENHID